MKKNDLSVVPLPMEEREETSVRRPFPKFAWIFYGLFALSGLLYLICLCSPAFADFLNHRVGSLIRGILALLTNLIPFSLAEYILLCLPLILFLVIRLGLRYYADSWHNVFVFFGSVLSVAALLLSVFLAGFAPGYRGRPLDQKLGLDRRDVSADELYETALILSEHLNEEISSVVFSVDTDFSVMPYGYEEMNSRLLTVYNSSEELRDFIPHMSSRIKPVMLSNAMSYTHITGVYSFFTGEANLNVAFPDYTLPFTAAHELAHQRGIAREDEANFMAFWVCSHSDDPYLRYSAYANLYEYVASALYSASPELYWEAYATLPRAVRMEQRAYSAFFETYRDSAASTVTETVNNAFLTLHGTPGTKSYGMVVDLAVAYYRSEG